MRYDAIVLGLGGMGSAAAYELARRGLRVLGLEQFEFAHARGSSHGQTRIIRTLYYEDPAYVPLVERAFAKWYELEQQTGRALLAQCPCLTVGPRDGELIRGVTAAAGSCAELASASLRRQYGLHVPEDFVGVLDPLAGALRVEECVRANLEMAAAHGAELRAEEPALAWQPDGDGVEVRTAQGTYRARKLVVAAGAWATQLLAGMGLPLTVMRQVMLWFRPHAPEKFRRDTFPIFLVDAPSGAFYGLPMLGPRGVKVALHYGAPELAGPGDVNWDVSDADEEPVRAFLEATFPGQFAERVAGQVCMYTLTPDRHFVIDRHPKYPQVAVAAGFSGHGFKFAPVVGAMLAALAATGAPAALFRADRFAVRSLLASGPA